MLKNYIKIAIRNLRKNKTHSIINIAGLSVGMAVTILIGLWIWDELSFDKSFPHYDRIAQVRQHQTFNGITRTGRAIPVPLAEELRKNYGSDFKYIVMSSWTWKHILTVGEKKISRYGNFMEADAPNLLSLTMLKGPRTGLKEPTSVFLSNSVARSLFGEADPIGKPVKLDNDKYFTVTGIYADLPYNTTLREISFIVPWDFYAGNILRKENLSNWGDNSYQIFAQVAENADMATVSAKIKEAKQKRVSQDDRKYNSLLFLQPMNRWHLYGEYKNGVNTGGRIQYVWLFGIIGIFVLLLACINFMNLSTARSEKRAKEVGIRKAVGSLRGQLVSLFYCESLVVAILAFVLSLILAGMILPFFNEVADKKMSILWEKPLFWIIGIGFSLFTGILAGSYPALYLSSFRPVKVLKGVFRAGPAAAIPRKVLIVLQFSVSVILIIGTIVVFKQIQYTKDRPVGYNRDGLIAIELTTDDLHNHLDGVRNDLINSGAVSEVTEATSSATQVQNNSSGLSWSGKDPGMSDDFAVVGVTPEYGKTMGWTLTEGRDFSRDFLTDSSAVILNEAAVKYMGLKNPLGEIIKWGRDYRVVGVVKDIVMQSPYDPVKQTIFCLLKGSGGYMNIRINPKVSTSAALERIEAVCKSYSPSVPFEYKFVDEEYARKFNDEERIGKLAGFFAFLAIFISCLGLFGMATFMAEQRIKEIGVRKVLGASVFNLWRLLSKDFVVLVIISLTIAMPLAYYFMGNWLKHYQYHSSMPWWVFAVACAGALLITLVTVSYQSIKAALMNPVKNLRTE